MERQCQVGAATFPVWTFALRGGMQGAQAIRIKTVMPPKKNPLKLNNLQLRTLVIAQVLAREDEVAVRDEATGAVTLRFLPQPHGDHFHIGKFTVPARAATGLFQRRGVEGARPQGSGRP